jgi:hypothetical protein
MEVLQKIQDEIKEWSNKTFGVYRIATPLAYHLKKEVEELIDALKIHYQGLYSNNDNGCELYRKDREFIELAFADCFILLLDCASRISINAESLLKAIKTKLEINKNRVWGKPDENGVIEHIEEGITENQFFNSLKNEGIAFFLNELVEKNPNDADLGKVIRKAVQTEKIFQI